MQKVFIVHLISLFFINIYFYKIFHFYSKRYFIFSWFLRCQEMNLWFVYSKEILILFVIVFRDEYCQIQLWIGSVYKQPSEYSTKIVSKHDSNSRDLENLDIYVSRDTFENPSRPDLTRTEPSIGYPRFSDSRTPLVSSEAIELENLESRRFSPVRYDINRSTGNWVRPAEWRRRFLRSMYCERSV